MLNGVLFDWSVASGRDRLLSWMQLFDSHWGVTEDFGEKQRRGQDCVVWARCP